MRLLVISESPLERRGDEYFAVDSWVRFVTALAGSTPVTLWTPVRDLDPSEAPRAESWRLETGALAIAGQVPYSSFAGYARRWVAHRREWRRALTSLARAHDLVLVRLPSPSLRMVMRVTREVGVPVVLLVAGDIEKQSDRLLESRGLLRAFYRVIVGALVRAEVRAGILADRVFAYSRELAERHRNAAVTLMRTPHLSKADVVRREDTCSGDVIRLLRVAWLLPSKGLETLLEALRLLVDRGLDARLTIVGEERAPGYREVLREKVRALGLQDRVEFAGWVPFDAMAAVYTDHDIQVISSLAEGTPRCITEGLARGLPLVCTRVGGCGDYLQDGQDALLVPPADAGAMADAVQRIASDGELRRSLISHGYDTVADATFEVSGHRFLDEIREISQRRDRARVA